MVKLILKSGYIKSGDAATGYLNYIATRERVEVLNGNGHPTPAQQKLIEELLHDFPDSKNSYEYADYEEVPTFGAASKFITAALDANAHIAMEREGYMKYIATRPRVERRGEHGLFSSEMNVSLDAAVSQLNSHPGNVWTLIFSLRREDAARLGYDNAEAWHNLLLSHIQEIASAMKIKPDQLRWYAAFHDEGHHPHVHMMVWSDDPKQGYLTKDGIKTIRSKLTNSIFRDEMYHLYEQKDISYKELTKQSHTALKDLTASLSRVTVDSPALEQKMVELSAMPKRTSGKKVYGYLKRPVKDKIDSIVDDLASIPKVAQCYAKWNELRDQLESYYKDKPREHLPLSQQKEFKAIKNIVIQEALKLEMDTIAFEDEGMVDEPEEMLNEEESAEGSGAQTIYQQAAEYRAAKALLMDESAPGEGKLLAMRTLERLWEHGFTVAAHQLGKAWRDGLLDGSKDDAKAEIWFRRSAEAGNDYSQYALGKLLQGQGKISEAVKWYEKADNQYAHYRLGKLYLTGKGVPRDVERAIRDLTISAESGNQYAQYALGKLYLMGKEAERNGELALRWLTAAARQGNEYAQFFLDHFDYFLSCQEPGVAASVIRLLHHMGRIFEDSSKLPQHPSDIRMDSKRRRQLMELKRARGLRIDDHEQKM